MKLNPTQRLDKPIAVSDHLLQVTEAAYSARDFEAFAQFFHLPQIVGTFEGDVRIETKTDLWKMFDAMCRQLDTKAVVKMHRRTIDAIFLDTDTVQATFVSQHLMAGNVLGDQIVAHGLIRYIDGAWKIAESRYAVTDKKISDALLAARKDE